MKNLSKHLEHPVVRVILLVGSFIALLVLINCYCKKQNNKQVQEGFVDYSSVTNAQAAPQTQESVPSPPAPAQNASNCNVPVSLNGVKAGEALGHNEVLARVGDADTPNNVTNPADCYPKDQLAPKDLLPSSPDSTWAQVNPTGQGALKDQNFLNAGYHVGVNTVGQTLRNANLQVRSEPANPQVVVSPWLQTTIEPDSNRKPLEIGQGCA